MFNKLFPAFSRKIWIYTAILYIFVARKTWFDVAKEVGNYSVTFDSGTFLAATGIMCSCIVILSNYSKICYITRTNKYFISYYILALFSFLWAGHFFAIAFKAIEVISCFLLVGIILLSLKSLRDSILYIIFLS